MLKSIIHNIKGHKYVKIKQEPSRYLVPYVTSAGVIETYDYICIECGKIIAVNPNKKQPKNIVRQDAAFCPRCNHNLNLFGEKISENENEAIIKCKHCTLESTWFDIGVGMDCTYDDHEASSIIVKQISPEYQSQYYLNLIKD